MTRAQTFGRYELLSRISAGGMAEVFRALHTPSGTAVALKRILPEIAEDDEFIQMFEDEARIASQLEHPHIARCLDFGRVDNAWFISFEFVDGKDLRALFDRCTREGKPPPVWFTVHVFSRIGEGLAYAHARKDPKTGEPVSIVHRDVSPQNIVVSFGGDVKLIDFGIAKAAGKLSRTQVGTIKGKFGYMSPEQVGGKEVDARADVFSLGICLWELLTLRRLFLADNELLVLEKIRSSVVEPPSVYNPDVPPELDRIVLKALAKDLDERYRSARDIYRDLNHLAQSINVVATREQIAQYMRRAFPEAAAASAGLSGGSGARQETRLMAADNKGGSDLDIFEGLAKKGSRPATNGPATPPPPARTQPPAPPPSFAPPPAMNGDRQSAAPQPRTLDVAKKTLVGLQSPVAAAQGATRSAPPPPPGRGSLPQIVAPPPRGARPSGPPPEMRSPSAPPGGPLSGTQMMPAPVPTTPAAVAPPPQANAQAKGGAAVDMDWDDEEEATHIFDKHEDSKAGPAPDAAPRPAAGQTAPAAKANLNQTMPLGQAPPPKGLGMTMPLGSSPYAPPAPGSGRTSAPPPPPSVRTAPPPPPSVGVSGGAFARASGGAAAPGPGLAPPPSIQPASQPPFPGAPAARPSAPPPPSRRPPPPPAAQAAGAAAPYVAPASIPPNRMEATALVRPPPSRTGLWIGLVAAFVVAAAVAAFFLWPRPGKLVVNVADAKGGDVAKVEIFVDGKKVCDTAPCIVDPVATGSHVVKAIAQGYDAADQTVTVEARKEATVGITLGQANAPVAKKTGTGLRVSGKQPGVKLSVDGKEIGPLPQELTDLAPGDHTIKIAGSDRYAPIEKKIIIAKDEMQDLGEQTLKVVKGKATITLATPGAKVYLVSGTDRRELPNLPIAVDIDTSKQWSLEASKPAYDDYHQAISFDDGVAEKTFDVNLHLKGAPATPTAPTAVAQVPPPAPTQTTAPTATATATDTEAAEPPAAPVGDAFLNINSIPPSSCFLDGRPLGSTPRAHVQVTPGTHQVRFVNSELGLTRTISVTVGAGETKLAAAKLN